MRDEKDQPESTADDELEDLEASDSDGDTEVKGGIKQIQEVSGLKFEQDVIEYK